MWVRAECCCLGGVLWRQACRCWFMGICFCLGDVLCGSLSFFFSVSVLFAFSAAFSVDIFLYPSRM